MCRFATRGFAVIAARRDHVLQRLLYLHSNRRRAHSGPPFRELRSSRLSYRSASYTHVFTADSMDAAAKAAAVLGVRGPGTGFRRRRLNVPQGPLIGDDPGATSARPHRRHAAHG